MNPALSPIDVGEVIDALLCARRTGVGAPTVPGHLDYEGDSG